jgi:uncharacterized protein YjeT (DUF2065 family)
MESLWAQIGLAIGLILVLEGIFYALFPAQLLKMMQTLIQLPPERLRMIGAILVGLGGFTVYIVQKI